MTDLIPPTSDDHGPLFKRVGPRCLWNFLYRSAPVLAHHPTAEAITKEDFVLKSIDCPMCTQFMRGRILEISVGLGREVKNVVERVSLSLHLLSHVCDVQWCILLRGRFPYPRPFPWDWVAPLPLQFDRGCKCRMVLCCSSGSQRYVDALILSVESEPKSSVCGGVWYTG